MKLILYIKSIKNKIYLTVCVRVLCIIMSALSSAWSFLVYTVLPAVIQYRQADNHHRAQSAQADNHHRAQSAQADAHNQAGLAQADTHHLSEINQAQSHYQKEKETEIKTTFIVVFLSVLFGVLLCLIQNDGTFITLRPFAGGTTNQMEGILVILYNIGQCLNWALVILFIVAIACFWFVVSSQQKKTLTIDGIFEKRPIVLLFKTISSFSLINMLIHVSWWLLYANMMDNSDMKLVLIGKVCSFGLVFGITGYVIFAVASMLRDEQLSENVPVVNELTDEHV